MAEDGLSLAHIAALIHGRHPEWTPEECVKSRLWRYQHHGRQGGKGFGTFQFRLHCTLTKAEYQVKIPEKCANAPNLRPTACELSESKDLYKALDMLLALAGPMLKEEKQA